MTRLPLKYRLSLSAEHDLEEIFDYTVREFGIDQAITYVSDFEEVFASLAAHPELGRKRDEIRNGLRSFIKNRHIIFYRIFKSHLIIVRILHCSRDIIKFV
jgi:toxin ParE1/3/4